MESPKNSTTKLIGLMPLRVLSCRTGPTKRLVADLHHVQRRLDAARNAAMEGWLLWHRTHAWSPPPALDDKGKPKFWQKGKNKGKPILESGLFPRLVSHEGEVPARVVMKKVLVKRKKDGKTVMVEKQVACNERGEHLIGLSTYLYHLATKAAPDVAAALSACAVKEVVSNLRTDETYKHGFLYRWQAIMARRIQIPTFVDAGIPVPNNASAFEYDGLHTGGSKNKNAALWGSRKDGSGAGQAVLAVPLFSENAGRKFTAPVFAVNVGSLSPGNRKILKKVAGGEWKWCDSRLICKDDHWQVQMIYTPLGSDLGLSEENRAVIWPCPPEAGNRPFKIEAVGADWKTLMEKKKDGKDREIAWNIGYGQWLAREYQTLDARRKQIRGRYRDATPGMKGHGRRRIEGKFKQWANRTHHCQRQFTWQLIKEIVRFCQRNDCGTVVYREPVVAMRDALWLAKNGAPYNWTPLATDLKQTLAYYGIDLEIVPVKSKELQDKFANAEEVAKTPGIAYGTQKPGKAGGAPASPKKGGAGGPKAGRRSRKTG